MHTRRVIGFLLGAWFVLAAGIAGVWVTATRVAEAVAKAPPAEAAKALEDAGPELTGHILRFAGTEVARAVLEVGGWVEVALLFALLFTLFLQNYSRPATVMMAVVFLAALGSHLLLSPQIVASGRLLDFRPGDFGDMERARLANVQMMHWAVLGVRLALGLGVTGILVRRRSGSGMRRRRDDIDL
jgi:hypothetical protein